MKKKFLSLMMAAAVVATTSVSAFAEDTIINNDGDTAEVTISGAVNGAGDTTPPGTLNVTVPTDLSFAVKNNGTVQGSEIKVVNKGVQAINVYAYEFADTTVGDKITVHKKTESLSGKKKSDVILHLKGNRGTAYFYSEDISGENKGVYKADGEKPSGTDGLLISNILKGKSDTLYLEGEAGSIDLTEKAQQEGISDAFTLRLKIKKAQ